MTKGALNVAINDCRSSLLGTFDGYYTLNDSESETFDHEVVLVGWDDTFPRTNFVNEASQDGAWIAQNSHGEKWGNDGYYMVSYDMPFKEQTIYRLTKDYSEVLHYDGGYGNFFGFEEETCVSNEFHHEGLLKAIGTYSLDLNEELEIEVLDLQSGKVVYEKEEEFEIPGYHTIKLEKPLELKDYRIIISYHGNVPVEGPEWSEGMLVYRVGINPGESFIMIDDEWKDLADESTQSLLGIDFLTNNVCIKALY